MTITPSAATADPRGAPPANPLASLRLDNCFARLGEPICARAEPAPLPSPRLVVASPAAAALLGLESDGLAHPDAVAMLAGNRPLPGAEPVASVYGGHRLGRWAGRLGDRHALLLGEAIGPDARRWALQLEGCGPTPFAAPGEGRTGLRAALREFLGAEAMHALGIPTVRGLAVVASAAAGSPGDAEGPAVLARLAPGFLSFGHFEHLYYCGRHDALRTLADFVVDSFYPALREEPEPWFALLREVTLRTARLVASWQAAGFCHGAMDTDRMSILGLTMGLGPFAFLDGFDAHHVADPADADGRYAYSAQPGIGEWNCYRLGQAMLPLLGSPEEAQAALSPYRRAFGAELERLLRAKLGLAEPGDADRVLFDRLFALLHEGRTDYTTFFRALAGVRSDDARGDAACRLLCADGDAFDAWAALYRERLSQEGRDDAARAAQMLASNPRYVPRAHLLEEAVRTAQWPQGDASEAARLLRVLAEPFDEQPGHERYAHAPAGTGPA